MSDFAVSITLIVVLALVIAAVLIRNWHVKDFDRKQRAKDFAAFVADTIVKRPDLDRGHGFFIDPKLAAHALYALRKKLPTATVDMVNTSIVVTYDRATWTIPVCTTEEYYQRYIKVRGGQTA